MNRYFIAILGGGPAGYTAAEKASKAGKDVVLFEQNAVGGTCLNVGCIPTKSLLYGAKQYYNASHAQKYGVTAENVAFDFAAMQKRKTIVVRKLVAGIKQRLNNEHCTLVSGAARVLSRTDELVTIECNGETYEAENLLICTGSTNFVPPIPGIQDNPAVWDSTDALAAQELPKSIIIVGGGVIGMEFATLYHELGVPVTVIEAMPTILPNLDQEVVAVLLEKYRKAGINILTSTKVTAVTDNGLRVTGADGEEASFEADKILVSVGRRANLQGLEALTDLELYRGGVVVDEFMKTNLDNVYACGDVTGKIMLAHVAARQAEVCIGRLLRQIPLQRIAYNAIPSVVYTNPEIATVGITEQQAAEMNIETEVRRLPMTFSGRFMAENEGETGLCKMVVDSKKQTVLGVHMIGNPCSEFVAAASFAVRNGYTIQEMEQVVFPHPTVSEILHEIL
ncbi:MAG: dihydrolipoyl dehydrogenase [Paludibacteraceae bacterium]|nr:dihydrolipoyl dehydrogenase [Paludibacteraceae bacterium]MBQ2608503.1 dihydrolipoyl dehydrogenase [Paludibacteraceae bacterium]